MSTARTRRSRRAGDRDVAADAAGQGGDTGAQTAGGEPGAPPDPSGESFDGAAAGDAARGDAGQGGDEAGAKDDEAGQADAGEEVAGGETELEPAELKRVLESLIFVADKPLPIARLRELVGVRETSRVRAALDELTGEYEARGINLDEVAGGYQFHTNPGTARYVRRLVEGKPTRLSRAQLETLAIVAYRQPITRPEIDEIRGVDSGATLKVLLDRHLIRILGKREEPGRPLLYGTTRDFLEFFNLGHISDLPTLREYHELTEDSMRQVERLSAELGERDPGRDASERAGAPGGEPADGPDEAAASPQGPGAGVGDDGWAEAEHPEAGGGDDAAAQDDAAGGDDAAGETGAE